MESYQSAEDMKIKEKKAKYLSSCLLVRMGSCI